MAAAVALLLALQAWLDWASYEGPHWITYALGALMGIALLAVPRLGFVALLVAVVLSDDHPKAPGATLESILATRFLGLTLVVPLTLLLLAVAGAVLLDRHLPTFRSWLRERRLPLGWPPGRPHAYFLAMAVPFVVGVPALAVAPRMFVHDAGYVVVPLAAYLGVRAFYPGQAGLHRLALWVVAAICARALWGLLLLLRGVGYGGAGELVFVLSSTRDLFVVGWMALLGLYLHRRALGLHRSWILLALAVVVLINIAVNLSTFNILATLLGTIFLVAGTAMQARVTRSKGLRPWRDVGIATLVLVGAIGAIHLTTPGAMQNIGWEISTLGRIPVGSELTNRSDVRVLEVVNILDWLAQRQTLWFGEGFGGWFDDVAIPYSDLYLGGGAYPDDHILAGTLYKPHENLSLLLLKGGLFLLGVFAWTTARMACRTFRVGGFSSNELLRMSSLVVAFLVPLLAFKAWSTALHLAWGLTMGLAVALQVRPEGENGTLAPTPPSGSDKPEPARRLRVLHITGSWPPTKDGVGDYTQRLHLQLQSVPGYQGLVAFGPPDPTHSAGTELVPVNGWGPASMVGLAFRLRRMEFDVIHLQMPTMGYERQAGPAMLPYFVRLVGLRKPLVVTIHEFKGKSFLGQARSMLAAWLADRVVLVDDCSRPLVSRWSRRVAQRAVTIPVGPNASGLQPREAREDGSALTFGYFGVIRPQKGLEALLKAFGLTWMRHRTARLLIVGHVDEEFKRQALNPILQGEPWAAAVSFSGSVPEDRLATTLARFDVAVLPFPDGLSGRRGSYQAVAAMGVPTLVPPPCCATMVPSQGPHTIHPPSLTPEDLAASMAQLALDPSRLASAKTTAVQVAPRHGWEAIAASHVDLYRLATGQHRS